MAPECKMTARLLTSCAGRDRLLSVPVILSKHRFRRESVCAGVIISMCERGRVDPPKAKGGERAYNVRKRRISNMSPVS